MNTNQGSFILKVIFLSLKPIITKIEDVPNVYLVVNYQTFGAYVEANM